MTKQVIGPRIPRSWLELLDDENWDVVDSEIESRVSQDLLKTCASFEPVSELGCCQVGMTAFVVGDVNAVCTLKCAHRRQLLAARALNGRYLLIRALPFPGTKTIGDENIDDVVVLSVLQFSDVQFASSPTLGFPLERRVSLMLITMPVASTWSLSRKSAPPTPRRGIRPRVPA